MIREPGSLLQTMVDRQTSSLEERFANESTPVFDAVMAALKVDPFAPAVADPQPRRVRRAGMRSTKGLTDRVYASIKPDGSIDPAKAVPTRYTNTGELPIIAPKSPVVG
jgi:hypothetical protein